MSGGTEMRAQGQGPTGVVGFAELSEGDGWHRVKWEDTSTQSKECDISFRH